MTMCSENSHFGSDGKGRVKCGTVVREPTGREYRDEYGGMEQTG